MLHEGPAGVRFPAEVSEVFFSKRSKPAMGETQHPVQLEPGVISPKIKRPRREADHSSLSSNEVKNE